jgi:glycosyltransferase involved in cell wall biosynthesis
MESTSISQRQSQIRSRLESEGGSSCAKNPLRIVISPPELIRFEQAVRRKSSDPTYIIQEYIAGGLAARGHKLNFFASYRHPGEIIYTPDPLIQKRASLTWSENRWFIAAKKASWAVQRLLGIPYLNYFENLRLLDAGMQCLPGNDIVYERNGLYQNGVAMACKKLGLPYILFVEADDILEADYMGSPITGLLRRRAKETAQYNFMVADCIVCVSEALKNHLNINWGISREKIIVFPNCVDVERFRPDATTRQVIRESLGVNSEPLVMFVGNFYQWHDVKTLLEAFSRILTDAAKARLVLVGDGSHRQSMIQFAAELGIDQATTFTGMVAHKEVPRYLAAADIAVVPYPPMETDLWFSPMKLFEYMASGTAVVASDIGQLTHVLQNGRNAMLVPPGDADALAAALKDLIDDPVRRSKLGAQAREDAVQKHSWDQYLDRLEKVFYAVTVGQPGSTE